MNQAPQQHSDGMKEMLFFSLLFVFLSFGAWFLTKKYIMWGSFYASFHLFGLYQQMPWLMTEGELREIIAARKFIPSVNPTNHGITSLFTLINMHGFVWRWVFVPLLLWWGYRTKKNTVRFNFRREIKDVYDLIEIQARHFPASAIIKDKNLLAKHPYVGPWATFALPLDFALDHQLLWTSKQHLGADATVDETTMVPIPPFTPDEKLQPFPIKRKLLPSYRYVALHIDKANEVFAKQLGPLWSGVENLPPLEKGLYAIICTQAAGENGKAWKMIEQLAFTFKEGQRDAAGKLVTPHSADLRGVDELLEEYAGRPAIKQIQAAHAHTYNVLSSTLALARKKGRLMHANLLWMRPVNPTLWYVICGQGGQTAYWEHAGPWAHAQVEQLMGRKITVPMVAGAVEAFRDTMSREHWIDPGDYSEEAQKKLVVEANELLTKEAEKARTRGRPGGPPPGYRPPPQKRTLLNDDDEP